MDEAAPPAVDAATQTPPPGELFCPECGYDLRGIDASDRCPECGLAIERAALSVSRIPWTHRRRIGRVRAYGRTVWLATFRTRRLAAEIARPVEYRDAQRFRLVTAAVAALAPVALFIAAVVRQGGFDEFADVADLGDLTTLGGGSFGRGRPVTGLLDLLFPWVAGALMPPVIPAAIALLALLWTGVATYWFHPRNLPVLRQNRAVALGYYACAPLAFLPLPAIGAGVIGIITAIRWDIASPPQQVVMLFAITLYVTLPAIPLLQYVATLRLLRRAAQAGAGRMWLAAILIPVTWVLSAVLALFVFPWVVGYVRLVVDSLG